MMPNAESLAGSLAPALREQCGGRLGPIDWFRCAWQSGGASTGFSTWTFDDGHAEPVMVKLPVGSIEHRWTTVLGNTNGRAWRDPASLARPTVRVVAAGVEVGGHDLAWLVLERLDGAPLSQRLTPEAVHALIESAADFQDAAARAFPDADRPPTHDWHDAIHRARVRVRDSGLPEAQRWNEALKKVERVMDRLVARWQSRPTGFWCHGDLHPGNALPRAGEAGRHARDCVLIDLALVHAGHWVEDAVYLERQFWGHADRLHGIKPVTELAAARRRRGLPVDDHYPEIAIVRRVMMASAAPLFVDREGNAKYLHAALEVIEKFVPQIH